MAGGELLTWRRRILRLLEIRNRAECICFKDLIKAHNKLFESADSMKTNATQLEIQVFQLQQEKLELHGRIQELSTSGVGQGGVPLSSEKTAALEQKLFKLQEELTEMHRRKGENAQKLIELNNAIRHKEEVLATKEAQLLDALNNQDAFKKENKNLEQKIVELEATNQFIKDELQALQLAYTALEAKHRKLESENRELVERWMMQKAKDADKVNYENELQLRNRQRKLQKELQEAAKEPANIPTKFTDSGGTSVPYCVITSIPTYPQTKFDANDGEVNAAAFSASGKFLATGGADKNVKIWETVHDQTCIHKGTLHGCNASVMSVQFDPQEKLVLASSNDESCRVWTIGDERLRHTLTGHSGKVFTAKFLGHSKVVSGSHDRTLKIWDLRSKACTKTIFAGSSCNDLVANEALVTSIISGHFDKTIKFWDIRKADSVVSEISFQGKVTSLDVSPNMMYIVASSRDDTLKLIDLRMNQVTATYWNKGNRCLNVFRLLNSADGFKVAMDYTRALFSPDGQYVLCGSYDGSIFVWDTTTAKVEKVLKEHSSAVVVCAWHPTGSSIISCDRNKHAIIWTNRY